MGNSDSGPGSLRDAVSKPNRIIVFDIGGVIKISSRIVVSKNIYIAGQSAPGGVCFPGSSLSGSHAHSTRALLSMATVGHSPMPTMPLCARFEFAWARRVHLARMQSQLQKALA